MGVFSFCVAERVHADGLSTRNIMRRGSSRVKQRVVPSVFGKGAGTLAVVYMILKQDMFVVDIVLETPGAIGIFVSSLRPPAHVLLFFLPPVRPDILVVGYPKNANRLMSWQPPQRSCGNDSRFHARTTRLFSRSRPVPRLSAMYSRCYATIF